MKLLLTAVVAPMADGILALAKPHRPLELLQGMDTLLTGQDPDQLGGESR